MRVPRAHLDTSKLEPRERLPAFQHVVRPMYDVGTNVAPRDFSVVATGHKVGPLVFNEVRFGPAHFHRSARHLQGSGSDFLVLEAILAGEQTVRMSYGRLVMRPGHVYLRDWAYKFDADADAMALNSIAIPRERLPNSIVLHESRPLISWSMAEPSGRLLSTLWAGLLDEFTEDLPLSVAGHLSNGFLVFLDELMRKEGDTPPVTLLAMQHFLRTRLQHDVRTAELCDHFRVSRSTVYRLFERCGGVQRYATRLRLERCYDDLVRADPQHRSVAEIAARWGFFDASSFSRRFKARFGLAPSAVESKGFERSGGADDQPPTGGSRRWASYARFFENGSPDAV